MTSRWESYRVIFMVEQGRAAEGRPKKNFLEGPFQRFVKKVFWNLESLNLESLNLEFWILNL
jgi:hypothetical protein